MTVVVEDAVDAAQLRILVPERSDSLVLVTAREPLELPAGLSAWVHQLPLARLEEAEAAELVLSVAQEAGLAPYEDEERVLGRLLALGAGLPLALRVLAPLGPKAALAEAEAEGEGEGAADPVRRALGLAYADLAEERRRLLRLLTLAGRASSARRPRRR
ncbi:hypothetical protein GCM10020254_34440 [Streptomyces goshikiensis]